MQDLEGRVALVTDGGKAMGRAIALALAAKGARVVVTGSDERPLGETVGEIAYGGGKARHLAGDGADPKHLDAAVSRAIDVFGGLDVVVAPMHAECTFRAAAPRMKGPGRLIAVASGQGILGLVRAVAQEVSAKAVTCNAIVAPSGEGGADAIERTIAALVVLLCSRDPAGITGQVVAISGGRQPDSPKGS